MTHRSALACSALLLFVGCSTSPSDVDCAEDADCGAGSVCYSGTCAGNAPPVADFDAPAATTTHRLVTLEAEASDPEGRPLLLRWSVEATSGGCAPEPEPEPPSGSALEVVFWCPGTYAATLVPVDDQGLEGAAVVRSFEVAPATGVPSVEAGGAIAATHLCDADVPVCVVAGPDGSSSLRLTAVGADPAGEPLAYEWSAIPPPFAADDPSLQVVFASGAATAAPIASIVNGSGGPIAGIYRFRVRVREAGGLLAQAFQEVVVSNGAPSSAPAPFVLEHHYAGALFVAEGDFELGAADPDGDVLAVEAALSPAAAAGCTEEVTAAGPGPLHVRIACAVATDLIGVLPRTLSVSVTDANGAVTALSSPLTILNRPPEIVLDPSFAGGVLAVGHRVEPCRLAPAGDCFVADGADPFLVVDPDGDPLLGYQFTASVAADRSSSRGTISIEGGAYRYRFETPVTLPLQFRSLLGVTGFTLSASIGDPWGATASVAPMVRVTNRAPFVKEAVPAVSVNHAYDAARRRYVAAAPGALFEDPDGDPLVPTVASLGSCASATIDAGRATIACERAWDYVLGGLPPLSTYLTKWPSTVKASDGWASASSATTVTILDRPLALSLPTAPAAAYPIVEVENCACVESYTCSRYEPGGTGIKVPLELIDPDGDPALVSVSVSFIPAQPAPVLCLPGMCYPAANVDPSYTSVMVSADPGLGLQPSELSFGVMVACSLMWSCCE